MQQPNGAPGAQSKPASAGITPIKPALAITLAQLNATVGDIPGNVARVREARARAAEDGADLVLLPELFLVGYPPEDLVLRTSLIEACEQAIEQLAADTADGGPALLLPAPRRHGEDVQNALFVLDGGRIVASQAKVELPNYGVFDEKRVFVPGELPDPIDLRGVRIGCMICEDMWFPSVARHLAEQGAEILLVPNGSPFELGKRKIRRALAGMRAAAAQLPLVYVNQVGGQDELVFDGGSFVVDAAGAVTAALPHWTEAVATIEWQRDEAGLTCLSVGADDENEETEDDLSDIYQAMMLGLRDYVRKNGFPGVVLGLSGGVDSALSAAVAVDALGADAVRVVRLPSRWTSERSQDDATLCAAWLELKLDTIAIASTVEALEAALAPSFDGEPSDIAGQNLQSRARGVLLMALSNQFGHMVLTTGNKSEMSVGYATLYGDMCGGFSVLKDVYKTTVYQLCHWRNRHHPPGGLGPHGPVVPDSILKRAPTAELKPDQTDQDSLPPYDQLDAILQGLIEHEQTVAEIAEAGHPEALVRRIQSMLYAAEYKRRQSPPGVKITQKNLGRDRRWPITNRFRD